MTPRLVTFFEKPGCATNTRQKNQLRAAGYAIDERDILATDWTPDALLPFLAGAPVAAWFNRAAPAVKSGRVVPEAFSKSQALDALCADHLLIRRPLIEAAGETACGFDNPLVRRLLDEGGGAATAPEPEGCRHPNDPEPPCNRSRNAA